jgi:hypothetical protein
MHFARFFLWGILFSGSQLVMAETADVELLLFFHHCVWGHDDDATNMGPFFKHMIVILLLTTSRVGYPFPIQLVSEGLFFI